MDFVERLSPEAASGHSLLALSHRHRYVLAAEACAGLRVADVCCGTGYGAQMISERARSVLGLDLDREAIAMADRAFSGSPDLSFEVGDAIDFLAQELRPRFDVLVLFEAIEHLPDPDAALTQLERHARDGVRLLISVPNDRYLEVENPYHVTRFDFDRAQAAFARFEDVTTLYQFNAEGSLIRSGVGEELDGEFALLERGEPAYANDFIACIGFRGGPEVERWRASMHLEVSPEYGRYLRSLERGNRELWRANAKLASDRIEAADSAAASTLHRSQLAEKELNELKTSLSWRITSPLRWPPVLARLVWRRVKPRLRALLHRVLR